MAYFSLFLSLFYLMSCPIIAIVDIKEFDNLYGFYPILQALGYILYLINNFKYNYCSKENENNIEDFQNRKLNLYFIVFNLMYIMFLLSLSYITRNIIILSFVLYPLGLKVVVIDVLSIDESTFNKSKGLDKMKDGD